MEKLRSKSPEKTLAPDAEKFNDYNPELPQSGGAEYDLGHGLRVWAGMVTPDMAARILEINQNNRPLRDYHARRIATLMQRGRWKVNGQTIKIGVTGDVLDGQHRLWAVIYSKCTVWLVLIYGIKNDAFSTIDTVQMPRSGADVLAVNGLDHHRTKTAAALSWLIRYERNTLETYRARDHRVENFDIEDSFSAHPEMVRAVARARKIGNVMNTSILAFIYYLMVSHDRELAERMCATLEDPSGVPLGDPFFRLRASMLAGGAERRREPLMVIALTIKAVNAAREKRMVETLSWRSQGQTPEPFPKFWWVR